MIPEIKSLQLIEAIDFEHGGVTRAVLDLASALSNLGTSTTLASPRQLSESDLFSSPKETPNLVKLHPDERFRAQVNELILECDVVHVHAPWWLKNPSIVAVARKLKKPVVLSAHGMLNDWSLAQKPWKKRLYRLFVADRMFKRCVVHCTAEEERRQVAKRITFAAMEVIPLVIDRYYFTGNLDRFAAIDKWRFLATKDVTRLLFLGRLHPKKSPEIAIGILERLPNSTLNFAGTGEPVYVDSLKKLAECIGVADRVHWLGMVSGDLKHSLMANCDFMVNPTQQENFGLAQVEALGCGLQLVTTKNTDNWRELQECGAIIADRTVGAFADAIIKAKSNQTGRVERLESQRSKLNNWISPDKVAMQYVEMYRRYTYRSDNR